MRVVSGLLRGIVCSAAFVLVWRLKSTVFSHIYRSGVWVCFFFPPSHPAAGDPRKIVLVQSEVCAPVDQNKALLGITLWGTVGGCRHRVELQCAGEVSCCQQCLFWHHGNVLGSDLAAAFIELQGGVTGVRAVKPSLRSVPHFPARRRDDGCAVIF